MFFKTGFLKMADFPASFRSRSSRELPASGQDKYTRVLHALPESDKYF
jgi:hypothetical protein